MLKKLDDMVCDIEWAMRLKEIGIRQDSFFHYVWDDKNDKFEICWGHDEYEEENYAAFTAQDFLSLFPQTFKLTKRESNWIIAFDVKDQIADLSLKNEDNLANVYARILISLTKNKLKSLGKLND